MTRMRWVGIPAGTIEDYLQGRPRDPRVKYTTGYRAGKYYKPNGKKEVERRQRLIAKVQVTKSDDLLGVRADLIGIDEVQAAA